MAPSNQECCQCAQFTSTTRKNRVAIVQVHWDICPAQLEALSSVWVPCLRPPSTIANEKPISEVGRMLQNGIFLCHSPHHASSVPLILSTQTGLVSPQFHCVFDDNSDTVKREQANTSIWKIKAHLLKIPVLYSSRSPALRGSSTLLSYPGLFS